MTLLSSLKSMEKISFVNLNFSSSTYHDTIIKTLEQNCVLKKNAQGYVAYPAASDHTLVVFCDEINLPIMTRMAVN